MRPDLLGSYEALIEESFGYSAQEGYRFKDDFFPLLNVNNWENCYGLLNSGDECVATVAVYERNLVAQQLGEIKVVILGGIAVAKKVRGQGLFRRLMNDVREIKRKNADLFLLWSEKEEMFGRFGFSAMFSQQILFKKEKVAVDFDQKFLFEEKKLCDLNLDEWEIVKDAFSCKYERIAHLHRNDGAYWDYMKSMKSVTCGLLKEKSMSGEIIGYYFMGKGKDLPGIVHEWALVSEKIHLIGQAKEEILQRYEIWDYPFFNVNKDEGVNSYSVLGKWVNQEMKWKQIENVFIGGVDSL